MSIKIYHELIDNKLIIIFSKSTIIEKIDNVYNRFKYLNINNK